MYAAIRIRGTVGIRKDIKDTLHLLNLERPNHCVILRESEDIESMLRKVKDYVAWGELDEQGLSCLLKRADEVANKSSNETTLDELLEDKGSYGAVAEDLFERDEVYDAVDDLDINTVIRLHPPRKGYKSTKRSFQEGGSLGYRGRDINDLIYRMR